MRLLNNRQQTTIIIGLLCLMVVIGRMAFDVYIPALPVIQHNFLTDEHQLQLSITLFSFGFGISQLFYGPLSDRFGRRYVLFIGLMLFILGSIFAFSAHDVRQLIFARFVSGLGVGVGIVIARAISRDLFVGKTLASVSATQTLALTSALFMAPIIGGYLLRWFSWRADFLFLIIFGVACLFIFFIALPETNTTVRKKSISDTFINFFVLLRHRYFMKNVLVSSFSSAGLLIYFQLTPFIFQRQYGLSSLAYSWLSLAIAVAYILGTASVKQQLKRYSINCIITHGILAMVFSGYLILLQYFANMITLAGIILSSMIYVYGFRLVLPGATANCLSPFKKTAGTAAALLGAILMGVSSLISFICSLVHINQTLLLGLVYILMGILSILLFVRNRCQSAPELQ